MYEDEIARVLAAGVPPIDLQVAVIRRCDTDEPRGCVARAVINSLALGTLTPAAYLPVTDADPVGLALTARLIGKCLAAVGGADAEGCLTPVVIPAPLSLLSEKEPERWLSAALAGAPGADPKTLCLCFDARLLTAYGAGTREVLIRLKRAEVALAVRGCGADDVPLAPLTRLPVDYAFLAPEATALAGDRVHNGALAGLVSYLVGMGQAVIAEGVTSEGQRRALDSMGCCGYLSSGAWCRQSGRGPLRVTPGEATAQTGGGDIG